MSSIDSEARTRGTTRAVRAILAFVLVCIECPSIAAIPSSERDVLVALYTNTDGAHWHHNENWDGSPGTECSWFGITCDAGGAHVTKIDLHLNGLHGSFPSVTALPQLSLFNVRMNSLSGSLPSFAGMGQLQVFEVGFNALSGEIPSLTGLGALTNLELNDNHFTGTIPSIAGLTNISAISFGANALTGTLPSLAGLSHLNYFGAYDNDLTGPVPSLADSPWLAYFDISNNRLTGHLPTAPPNATPGGIRVCPNLLDPDLDPAWDALTGNTPWYVGCNGAHLNLNQYGISGSWYDPGSAGQGIVMAAIPDIGGPGNGLLFGGWFTYAPQASMEPTGAHWFSLQGTVGTGSSQTTLDIYETLGGSFGAPPLPTTSRVGSAVLNLVDCTHGIMSYHFDDGRVSDSAIYMRRVTSSTTCTLTGQDTPPPQNSRLSGAWYDPASAGQGFVIDVVPLQSTLFAAWYTFAPNAASGDPVSGQRWYVLQAGFVQPDATSMSDVIIYEPPQGVFGVTSPEGIFRVGTASFEFEGCDALTLTYRFDAPDDRQGTLRLARLGPTPAECQ